MASHRLIAAASAKLRQSLLPSDISGVRPQCSSVRSSARYTDEALFKCLASLSNSILRRIACNILVAPSDELRQRVKRIRRTRPYKQMLPADAAELGGKPVRVDGLAVDVDVDEILTIFGHNSVRDLDGGYLYKIVFAR